MIRVADSKRIDLSEVTYDFGGRRLDVDPVSRTLFAGACQRTGIAAYDFESGTVVWERRDIRQLGELAYDGFEDVLYCICERRTVLLNAATGKEWAYYRNLNDVFFGRESGLAVFDAVQVKLLNRAKQSEHVLLRESENILCTAFTKSAVVLSWVSGPVTAYTVESGELLWTYTPEGTHAYSIAPASDGASVWVAEQSYNEPPWHRLRLLSPSGIVEHEVRCALGHSYEISPYSDSVIRGDLLVTPIMAMADS